MPILRSGFLATALAFSSCGPPPPSWDSPGDPCNSPSWCTSSTELRECEDRRWVDVDCDERCTAEGLLSAGCQIEIQGARCLCEACSGPLTCIDDSTIETCVAGEKVATSCVDECAAHGYDTAHGCRMEVGAEAKCQCSNASTCTVEGQARCVDSALLATCQAGAWAVVDCRTSCPDELGVCTLDVDSGAHVCACKAA